MPTRWDESHVLDAAIGGHTVTARRNGATWYLGSVTDEKYRSVPVPLDFLDEQTTYVADIYSDAGDASWKGNPTAVEVKHALVDSTDTLEASMVGGGGQAVKFREATDEDLAELSDYVSPVFALDGTPDDETVAGAAGRIGGGETRTFTFTVPIDSITYGATNELSVVSADSGPGESVPVGLLPYPTGELLDLLGDRARDLAPARAALLEQRAERRRRAARGRTGDRRDRRTVPVSRRRPVRHPVADPRRRARGRRRRSDRRRAARFRRHRGGTRPRP